MFVSVGANTEEFQKSMSNMQKTIQNTGKRVSDKGKTLSKYVSGPIAAAGGAVAGLTKKFASHGDEIAKTSQKLGISTDAYQELEYAMGQVDMEEKQMEKALGRLNQRMGRATEGNENLQEAFMDLGYSMEEIENLDTDEAFMDIIHKLHEMEDSQQQSAMASEIFGTKMARDMMPAIKEGGDEIEKLREEAHEMGIVMDEEAIEASEDFEDSIDNLTRAFKGVFQQVAQEIIPVLVDDLIPAIEDKLVPLFRDFGERIAGVVKWFADLDPRTQKIIGAFVGLVAALGPVLLVVGKLITAFGTVTGAIAALNPVTLGIIAVFGTLIYVLQDLWRNNEEFREAVIQIWTNIKQFFQQVFEAIKNIIFTVLEAVQGFWNRWGDEITEFITSTFEAIWDIISKVMEAIKEIVSTILDAVMEFWDIFGDSIMSVWEFAFDTIWGVTKSIMGAIRDTIEGVFQTIEGILDVFIGVLTGDWERAWEGLEAIVKGSANVIIGLVNGIIGAVESMVGAIGGAIDRVPSFDVPGWVPGIGGESFSLPSVPEPSFPRIPKLHDGGQFRVRGPGTEALALLGHGEVVTPADDVGGGNQTIIVELDGRQIAKAIGDPMTKEIRLGTGLRT